MKRFLHFTENKLKTFFVFVFLMIGIGTFAQTEVRVPDGDITTGTWTATPLWSKINATGGTFISTPNTNNASNTNGDVTIQNPTNAGTYTSVTIRFDAKKDAAGGSARGLDANIRINNTLQGVQTVTTALTDAMVSYTVSWTGLSFTQTEMNSLEVVFTSNGSTGAGSSRRVVQIDYLQATLTYCNTPATPSAVTATNSAICLGSSSNLNATSVGNTIRWYTVASGGTSVGTSASGANFSVSPVTTTTYYAEALSSGGCISPARTAVVVTVNQNTVGAPSSTAALCLNSVMTNITCTTTGATGIGSPSGLPAGITAAWASNTITISGTPTASGVFNYTIPLTGGCGSVSATGTLTVNPSPTNVLALESASTICSGNTVNLMASANSNSALTTVVSILNENFNSPTNNWTTTNTSIGGTTPANAAWTLRPNAYVYSTTTFNSNDNTQFYLTNSDAQGSGANTSTTLTSPSFTTVGLASASLSFYHYYRSLAGQTGVVKVSTNGTTWTNLQSFTTDTGSPTGFVQQVVNLSSYLNQATVYIRFEFTSPFGWYWAIDNVSVSGISSTPPPPTYAWTSTPSGFISSFQNPTGVAQTVDTYYTVTATNNYGCSVSDTTNMVEVSTINTWVGTNTSWNNSSNWSCGYVPTASSDVTISTAAFYPEISSDVTINSLVLDSGTTLKVNAAYDLTVTDIIDNDGTLTVENTANLLQVNNVANTGSGSTVIKRNSSLIKRLDYTLWSSPVTGQGLYAFSPTTLPNRFYVYNTSNDTYNNSVGFNLTGLQYPSPLVAPNGINGTDTNNVQFALGKSYLIRTPWDHPTAPAAWTGTFTGVANNGNLNYAMSTGYNAVGNVYPSRINVHDFIDGNPDISGPLYFWRKTNDASSPSYATLTKLAYTQNFAVGGDTGAGFFNVGNEANWVINVGQGFIVNATSNANLNFTNSMRRSLNSNQFFRAPQNTTTSVNDGVFWLNLSNATTPLSQMAVGYISDATLGVDRGIDGKNINQEYFLTSLIDTDNYSIQGRPGFTATDVVPLSYKVLVAGNHSISIDHSSGIFATGQLIYLRDNLTSTVHDLTTGAYNFTSDSGTFSSRFDVIYQAQLGVGAPVFNANQVVVYQNEADGIVINTGDIVMSSVKVFDVRGRLLFSSKEINATQTTITTDQVNQVLLVQITSQDGLVVTKKVIR